MHVVWWYVLIGAVVGVLAKVVAPGRGRGGWFVSVFVGVAGALLTIYIGEAIDFFADQASMYIGAAAGAVAIVLLHRLLVRND